MTKPANINELIENDQDGGFSVPVHVKRQPIDVKATSAIPVTVSNRNAIPVHLTDPGTVPVQIRGTDGQPLEVMPVRLTNREAIAVNLTNPGTVPVKLMGNDGHEVRELPVTGKVEVTNFPGSPGASPVPPIFVAGKTVSMVVGCPVGRLDGSNNMPGTKDQIVEVQWPWVQPENRS